MSVVRGPSSATKERAVVGGQSSGVVSEPFSPACSTLVRCETLTAGERGNAVTDFFGLKGRFYQPRPEALRRPGYRESRCSPALKGPFIVVSAVPPAGR